MSAEFQDSSEEQQPDLSDLPTMSLREMAEDDVEYDFLSRILRIAINRHIEDGEDEEVNDLAQFVADKQSKMRPRLWDLMSAEDSAAHQRIEQEARWQAYIAKQALDTVTLEEAFFDNQEPRTEQAIRLAESLFIDTDQSAID